MVPEKFLIFKIIQCDGNLRCSMLTVPSIMLQLMFLVKLYACQFNSSKIKDLIDRLDSDWKKLEGADEQDIMKTYAANARLLSLAYCCKAMEISMTAMVAHDCMLLICIQHICSVFAVAGFRFGILSRIDRNDTINNDVYDQKFAVSVYAHWRALQFAQLLEKTFCVFFAVQIMIVTVG
ncbi:uncharacterized protein LOC112463078, partial [Temnothorax curvispinosus]|uniref:Uncharacterized protein LOC112463078 n=1 Tax=Temnothorax curvispinosus TaxID=300111 RepID=A0A6J1QRC7_9HYME